MQPRQSVKTTKDGQLIFKVLILGDSGVGKTSLLVRFCDDDFVSAHVATVGIFLTGI